ncbi:unnamed protein product [Sympodiomycopsis kandeliae]
MAPHPVDQAANVAQHASSQAQSSASRFLKWVEDNSKLVLAVTGTAVVVGAGAYYYSGTSRRPGSKGAETSSDSEKADGSSADQSNVAGASSSSKNKKKKKSGKKAGAAGGSTTPDPLADPAGPLLEELDEKDLVKLSADQIRTLPQDRRESLAQTLKTQGNKKYQDKKYEQAIELYTKAIAAHPQAVFYSNRAACHALLKKPKEVIEDCNAALELNPTYSKPLSRRATAAKQLGSGLDPDQKSPLFEEKTNYLYRALLDFTAVTLLSEFKDENSAKELEAVIQELSLLRTKETLRSREVRLPSPVFLAGFFDAFRKKPLPELPENASQGDQTLRLAYEALEARNYPHAFSLVNEALEQGTSTDDLKALALNLRGSFWFVVGKPAQSLECFEEAVKLSPSHSQSWIKKAAAHLESGDAGASFAALNKAEEIDPNDPDVHYQRGQTHYLLGDLQVAIKDYTRSIELDDTFIYAHIQKAVAQYKLDDKDKAMAEFRGIIHKFEGSADAHNFYGEVLLDAQRYEDAISQFDKAIEIESKKTSHRSPVALINKALTIFQWKEDMAQAERLVREAVKIDEDHDVAVASLAQFSQLQGNIPEALKWFRKSASIARTEGELQSAILSELAALAQQNFINSFGGDTATLQALAARHHFSQAQAQAAMQQ